MSSLRNAVKRIAHKERSQPVNRQHLGILEKKKDYKQRADDYHKKEKTIKRIREKAAMRNPDEFYFGMNRTQVKDGKHVTNTESRDLPPEIIRLMKDQDLSYIRTQKQKELKKIERLQMSLHFMEHQDKTAAERKHTVFVDDIEEADNFSVAAHFQTTKKLSSRAYNRPRKAGRANSKDRAVSSNINKDGDEGGSDAEDLHGGRATYYENDSDADDDSDVASADENARVKTSAKSGDKQKAKLMKVDRKTLRKSEKARERAYLELEARKERAAALEMAEKHLVTEKNVQAKGRKRKVGKQENGKPAQFKWRRKRLK